MKKITAMVLAVVMMLSLNIVVPVVAKEVSSAEELHAALVDDQNVTLTDNVDLTGYDWTVVPEYTGTLDGAGYTINLGTQDDSFIGSLYGTVKNLTFTGSMNPDNVSDATIVYGFDAGEKGLGVVANNAVGATIENVDCRVNVTFALESTTDVNFGCLVGIAMSEYDEGKNSLVAHTSIVNCQTYGTIDVDNNAKNGAVGGIVGKSYSDTTIEKCASYVEVVTNNYYAHFGGILGSVMVHGYTSLGYAQDDTDYSSVNIKNCIFAGNLTATTNTDQAAGILGYCNTNGTVSITSCFFSGMLTVPSRDTRHIFGYSKLYASGMIEDFNITACASVGQTFKGQTEQTIMAHNKDRGNKQGYIKCKDNFITGNQSFSGLCTIVNNVKLDTAAEVKVAFVEYANANSDTCVFVIENDEVVIVRDNEKHDYKVMDNNVLSAGICTECGAKSDADYAGLIQFAGSVATSDNRVRVLMVISEDELNNAEYDSFTMTITINGDSYSLPDTMFTAYTAVTADGVNLTAADGYQIFGVILELKTIDVLTMEVDIVTGNDPAAGTELYSATYSKATN